MEHFGCMFLSKKTVWGARGATRGAKVEFPSKNSPIGTLFGRHFLQISGVLLEIDECFHRLFKASFLLWFLCVLDQTKTVKSIENIAQAIKNRGCRKSTTNRSSSRFGMDLDVILGAGLVTNVCFC